MIELMVVLAVAAILLMIGAPGFRSLIQNQKLTTTVNELFMAVNLARSEAIHRGARVDLVPAGDGTDWASGWLVFVDQNNDQRPDAGEQIILSHGPLPAGISITSNWTYSNADSPVQYLAYNGTGRTRTNADSQTSKAGSWVLQLDGQYRKIAINFLGRPRVCNPALEAATCKISQVEDE